MRRRGPSRAKAERRLRGGDGAVLLHERLRNTSASIDGKIRSTRTARTTSSPSRNAVTHTEPGAALRRRPGCSCTPSRSPRASPRTSEGCCRGAARHGAEQPLQRAPPCPSPSRRRGTPRRRRARHRTRSRRRPPPRARRVGVYTTLPASSSSRTADELGAHDVRAGHRARRVAAADDAEADLVRHAAARSRRAARRTSRAASFAIGIARARSAFANTRRYSWPNACTAT